MIYINMKNNRGEVETIDEYYNYEEDEAYKVCHNWQIADTTQRYYLSKRCTKEWKNRE